MRREYYLGNENIHILTKKKSELKIDVENFSDQKKFAKYGAFSIYGEDEGYQLSVSGKLYSGNAGNLFWATNGNKFTTWDKDNDFARVNCASYHFGGWWFSNCYSNVYLNCVYFPPSVECPRDSGMKYGERVVRSMMKIRRVE